MKIAKRVVQFLKSDETGNYGVVVSVDNGVATIDLEDGLSAKVEGKTKGVGVDDKIYFDDEGVETKVVAAPRRERTEAAKHPRQGTAYKKHEI